MILRNRVGGGLERQWGTPRQRLPAWRSPSKSWYGSKFIARCTPRGQNLGFRNTCWKVVSGWVETKKRAGHSWKKGKKDRRYNRSMIKEVGQGLGWHQEGEKMMKKKNGGDPCSFIIHCCKASAVPFFTWRWNNLPKKKSVHEFLKKKPSTWAHTYAGPLTQVPNFMIWMMM